MFLCMNDNPKEVLCRDFKLRKLSCPISLIVPSVFWFILKICRVRKKTYTLHGITSTTDKKHVEADLQTRKSETHLL